MNHKFRWSVVTVVCLALLVIAQLSGFAATYYVSTTGNDANSGLTTAAAWATIDNGDRNSLLHAGDTVLVQPGTYNPAIQKITTDDLPGWNVSFRNCSGTSGNPITYKANGAVQINGTADYGSAGTGWGTIRFQNVSYCVLNGFIIDAANHSNIELELDDAMGPVSNIIVENCSFRNCAYGATVRAVVNCQFHNNVLFNCSTFGLFADGYKSGVSTGNKIWNNTLVNCAAGANVGAGDVTTEYRNNIFENCGTAASSAMSGSSMGTVTRSNNLFWPALTAPSPLGSGDITANPLLGSSLELLAGSPAINAGINVGLPYNGSAPDMGAFESGTTPPSGGTVTGQVTCAGAPLVGASVGVGAYATAVTDANGNYTLSATAGTQNVTASKTVAGTPGYTTATQQATVPANGSVTLNFALTANAGTTYYVNPGYEFADDSLQDGLAPGDDPVHGPWATLSGGAGILKPGDIVKVVGSTTPYTESSQMVPGGSGSAGFPITYEAVDPVTYNYSAYAVTFDWTNSGSGAGFNTASKSYLVVEGINFNQTGGFSANSSLIAGGHMTGVVIQSCTFTSDSWNWHCVDLPGCNYCTFENNVVGPLPYSNSTGVSLTWGGIGNKVDNNTFNGCSNTCVDAETTVNNGTTLSLVGCEIKNNIMANSSWQGLNDPAAVYHSNNLLYNDGSYNTATPPVWTERDYVGTIAGPGEIVGKDPKLDSTDHLLAGSPCIDAGCLVGLPFNGAMPDIGAFESAFAQPIPNTTPQGSVNGKVTNAATGNPLGGAIVSAGTTSTGVTDSNGNYTLTTFTGSQQFQAAAGGYGTVKQTITVASGSQTVNFALTSGVAGVFYVSPTGNDGNDGVTSNSAWASINNGDVKGLYPTTVATTVHVLPGTYTCASGIAFNKSGTATYPITYTADEGPVTVNFTVSNITDFQLDNRNYITLNGLNVVGSPEVSGQNTYLLTMTNSQDLYGQELPLLLHRLELARSHNEHNYRLRLRVQRDRSAALLQFPGYIHGNRRSEQQDNQQYHQGVLVLRHPT